MLPSRTLSADTNKPFLATFIHNIGEDGAQELAAALKNNTSIVPLIYFYNSGNCYEARPKKAPPIHKIISLALTSSDIGRAGAVALADALKTNTSVTLLDLSYNSITAEGAKALADALIDNKTLHTLKFACCNIGEAGAMALANALKRNNSLASLDLTSCNISEAGATALANALIVNSSLTSLLLWNNKNIADTGARAFAEVLKVNAKLRILNLALCHISQDGASELADALIINTTLTNLAYVGDLYFHGIKKYIINQDTKETIRTRLKANTEAAELTNTYQTSPATPKSRNKDTPKTGNNCTIS